MDKKVIKLWETMELIKAKFEEDKLKLLSEFNDLVNIEGLATSEQLESFMVEFDL